MNYEDFLTDFQRAKLELGDFVVVTLTHFQGSAPQILGARMIAGPSGYFSGTVGGGKLEKHAIEAAINFLDSRESSMPISSPDSMSVTWNLQTDLGMSCGGVVSLLFEKQLQSNGWEIAIFGAGHVGQELARVLSRLNCQIILIDPRKDWLEKLPTSRSLKSVLHASPENYVSQLSNQTFVVVSTMGHATDLPILQSALPRKFPFIGAIGSAVKAEKLKKNLLDLGVTTADLQGLHCPIGEPIGNNTPPEIALSIAAQLLRIRDLSKG
jgi:xanthine dehydrogenase accessory factor